MADYTGPAFWLLYAAVGAQMAIAATLYAVAPRSALHRTFALFIGLNAVWDLADILAALVENEAHYDAWARAIRYAYVPTNLALIAALPLVLGKPPWLVDRRARWVLAGLGVLWITYLIPFGGAPSTGEYYEGTLRLTKTTVFHLFWYPTLVVGGALLARRNDGISDKAMALGLLAYPMAGLGVFPTPEMWEPWTDQPGMMTDIMLRISYWGFALSAAASVVILGYIVARNRHSRFARFALGFGIALSIIAYLDELGVGQGVLSVVPALSFAGFMGYAVLRGRLFDIDVRVHVALNRLTFVVAVLLAFLLIAELLAVPFGSQYVRWISVVAVVLVATAARPIHFFSGKVSQRLTARFAVSEQDLDARKREVYRRTLQDMLAAGSLRGRDRRDLDVLRQRLALDRDDVIRLEADLRARR